MWEQPAGRYSWKSIRVWTVRKTESPPQEKRAKAINTKDLEAENIKIETEVAEKGIVLPNEVISGMMNDLSLYK